MVECNLYVQWVKHRGERFTAALLIRNSLRILSGTRLQEGLYPLHIIRATDHHKRIPGVAQTDDGAGCIVGGVGCCGGDGLLQLLLSNPLHRDHRTQLAITDQPVYPSSMHASGTDQLSDSQDLRSLRQVLQQMHAQCTLGMTNGDGAFLQAQALRLQSIQRGQLRDENARHAQHGLRDIERRIVVV